MDYDREARNKFYFDLLQKLNAQLLNPSMLPEVSQVTSTKPEKPVISFEEEEDDDLPF